MTSLGGGILGCVGGVLGHSGGVLGCSVGVLGMFQGVLGSFQGVLGVSEVFWGVMGVLFLGQNYQKIKNKRSGLFNIFLGPPRPPFGKRSTPICFFSIEGFP